MLNRTVGVDRVIDVDSVRVVGTAIAIDLTGD